MVIFYNKDLVDFDRMERRGLDVPAEAEEGEGRLTWNFDQFAAAADFATRPRRGTKGVYVAPTLEGLAPFIYSGGGADVRRRERSEVAGVLRRRHEGRAGALTGALPQPHPHPERGPARGATPLQWFRRGKLGMLAGYRSWSPACVACRDWTST